MFSLFTRYIYNPPKAHVPSPPTSASPPPPASLSPSALLGEGNLPFLEIKEEGNTRQGHRRPSTSSPAKEGGSDGTTDGCRRGRHGLRGDEPRHPPRRLLPRLRHHRRRPQAYVPPFLPSLKTDPPPPPKSPPFLPLLREIRHMLPQLTKNPLSIYLPCCVRIVRSRHSERRARRVVPPHWPNHR